MSAPQHPSDALLALVYGELSGPEAQAVQTHLEGCASCAATVEGYRAVRRAAAALPREFPSAAGLDSLLHYGAQTAARARRTRWALWGGPLLGALAAVVLVLFLQPSPKAPKTEAPSLAAPPAIGPLAQNDAPLGSPEDAELAEGPASLRRAPALPPPRPSPQKAAKAKAGEEASPAREAGPLPEALDRVALKKTAPAAASPAPVPEASGQRAAVVSTARGAAVAAPAASVNAPAPKAALAQVQAVGRLSSADATVAPDGGNAQRLLDEGRRRTLLSQLEAATGQQRLPLLSELCAVEVRLGRRADALKTCAQVEEGFPGTPEAAAAQRARESLPPP